MQLLKLFIFLLLFPILLPAQPITVGDAGDYQTLSATESILQPGDTVYLLGQIFDDGAQFLTDVSGTATAPIVIMANPGDAPVFSGGTEAIHLVNCRHIELNGIIIEQQTGNGINIDDGGDYSTPAAHITVRNCEFRNMAGNGNNDFLKLSGLDSFLIENCTFTDGGGGGAGIDMVGCHWGLIQDCVIDNAGVFGIQNKGGTRFMTIRRNILKNMSQRAINLGGSTGLQFFRPPLPDPIENAYEASDINVFANIFMDNWAPIAYVGAGNISVRNNTIYSPDNWVIRILQENTTPGFLPCQNNEFSNNIIYLDGDLREVNIGGNTEPTTFTFSHNLWFNASSNNWSPELPVTDMNQLIQDPLFSNAAIDDFSLLTGSPAISSGNTFSSPTSDFFGAPFASPPSRGAIAFDGALPVNLGYFTAALNDKTVQLTWQTNIEQNNNSFIVERTSEGQTWQSIGRVSGAGNSSNTVDYSLTDEHPEAGINYYRLKQIDHDGEYTYSGVVQVWFYQQQAAIKIYPNPVSTTFHLETGGLDIASVKIIDLTGKLVFSAETSEIDFSSYSPGIYNVVVTTSDNQVHYLKLVK